MSQQKQETLSAFFDGELGEFEMRRLLTELSDSDVQQWRRYQLLRDCCHEEASLAHYRFDISQQVAAAIAQPAAAAKNPSLAAEKTWQKPLFGFASAAAIAFVAVFGVQQWQMQDQIKPGFVAEGNVSASQLPLNSSPGLSAASATSAAFVVSSNNQTAEEAKVQEKDQEENPEQEQADEQ